MLNYSETFWIHNNQGVESQPVKGSIHTVTKGICAWAIMKTPNVRKESQITATSPSFLD